MDAQLQKLLKDEEPHFSVEADGRIKCTLNGHCFPARFDVISAFVKGSKYQNMKRKSDANNFTKWEPFIVPSKNRAGYLFCALTCRLIERDMSALKRHLDGKKFAKAKARFMAAENEGEGDLMEEPTLEGEGGAVAGAAEEDGMEEEGGFWVPAGVLSGSEDEMAGEPSLEGAEDAEMADDAPAAAVMEASDEESEDEDEDSEEEEDDEEPAPRKGGKAAKAVAPAAGKKRAAAAPAEAKHKPAKKAKTAGPRGGAAAAAKKGGRSGARGRR